jgi:hypothetical protein
MKHFINVLAAMVALSMSAVLSTAQAQSVADMIDSSFAVYAGCLQSIEDESLSTPDRACACLTGYLGGKMSDREYVVLGYVMRVAVMQENGASELQINAVVQELIADGYTLQEVQSVASLIDQYSARGDAICAPFQQDLLNRTS